MGEGSHAPNADQKRLPRLDWVLNRLKDGIDLRLLNIPEELEDTFMRSEYVKAMEIAKEAYDTIAKEFPEEERIEGKNLKEDFSKTFKEIKSKIIKK